MKTLIIDDELVSRKKLQKIMEGVGDCVAFDNGEEGLKAAVTEDPPDLILLDIMMPGLDGYDVLERLKAAPQTKGIPVIFLSAMDEKEDIIRGLEMGAVDYITKPFHKSEVRARVQIHLSLKKMQKDLEAQNVVLGQQVLEIQEKTEELRQKDLQLLEMDRVAGIGTLAAGIAHEINNPLGFVKSSIDSVFKGTDMLLAAVRYWDDKPLPESLQGDYRKFLKDIKLEKLIETNDRRVDRIRRGIERIMKIVNSLKSFSRVDMAALEDININQSIDDALEILGTRDSDEIQFIREFKELPLFKCSGSELNQCLLHVINNALDAVELKGVIRFATSYDQEKEEITIQVEDNGKGMSEEVLRRAFDPFFTTKAVGSGTGVGLSLTERIIKGYGGSIRISSREGEGTLVSMSLPVPKNSSAT